MNNVYRRTYWPSATKKVKTAELITVTTDSKILSILFHIWYYWIKGYGWILD